MLVKFGSAGSDVFRVQQELLAAGCDSGSLDGAFGDKTKAAVMDYQRRCGLTADGVVGERTWAKMLSDGFEVKTSESAAAIVAEAASHIGYREGAGNRNKFSAAMGRPAESWCADFVSFLARNAGLSLNTASAEQVHLQLAAKGSWKGRSNPQPGDAVTFRWDGSHGWADHVGIVEKVFQENGRSFIQTIEGNSNNMVRRRTYAVNDGVINGFGRIV